MYIWISEGRSAFKTKKMALSFLKECRKHCIDSNLERKSQGKSYSKNISDIIIKPKSMYYKVGCLTGQHMKRVLLQG